MISSPGKQMNSGSGRSRRMTALIAARFRSCAAPGTPEQLSA
jgi:hypothetical protein